MKKLIIFLFVLTFAVAITGCKNEAPGGEIELGRAYSFDGVTQVTLTNAHNGYTVVITDKEDVAQIVAFVGKTVGKPTGSGKGYYEGSYCVDFFYENGQEFSIGYGDDNVFYMGKGNDGYPIRYRLTNITISDDILPFFSQYDESTNEQVEAAS